MRATLGIDTSGYTTSCALVDEELRLIASHRLLLKVEQGKRGLRQSEAVFAHLRQLPDVFAMLKPGPGLVIDAVCVSVKPAEDADSYMPVFRVGQSFAEGYAALQGIPCYHTTHQRGHIAAAGIGLDALPQDYLAMHLSGGTTELLSCQGDGLSLLGHSLDLHAGQLIDRLGVQMGCPFPAGPCLEALAVQGSAEGRYPSAVREGNCSFSGIEAQVLRDCAAGLLPREDIAREIFDALCRTILKMLSHAAGQSGTRDALLFGGVASSALLRRMLSERLAARDWGLRLHFGKPDLSGDNAAGIALIGARKHHQKR